MTKNNYLGIEIDYSRDSIIPEQGYAMLTKKGFYKKDNEKSPQESFARAATCYAYGDLELAQRLYDAVSKQWFTFASPVLSNAVEHVYPSKLPFKEVVPYLKSNIKSQGLPISCFLSYIPDTREGLVDTRAETSWLSMMGGGVGLYAGMRSVDEKSTGVMAHMKGYDADAKAYKQGECYLPDTEILTEFGWKKFKEVKGFEKVVTVLNDNSYSIEDPLEWTEHDFSGKLINFSNSNRGMSVTVTPNHRMMVNKKSRKYGWSEEYTTVFAKDLKTHNELRFKQALLGGGSKIDALTQFKVALSAEGHKHCDGSTITFHFSKDRKINRMRDILTRLSADYTENKAEDGTTNFFVRGLYSTVKGLKPLMHKDITPEEAKGIVKEVSYWDSYVDPRVEDTYVFSGTVKEDADTLMALSVLAGYGSRFHEEDREEPRKKLYTVRVSPKKHLLLDRVIKSEVDYEGKVNCCIVKSGRIVVRSGETTLICGNTRRGSYAAYLPVDHPEILSFIDMRSPVGGDPNLKCFNLNNGVNITDEFMVKVAKGESYELIDPKHGATGRFLDAREVWHKILEVRKDTGEPYLEFIDTVNKNIPSWISNKGYYVSQSNLCVAPETQILTSKGYIPIAELEDENVKVWNGEEFSETTVKKTGEGQKLVRVTTSSGQQLECTPYHKWYVFDGYGKPYVEKRTHELVEGDKLAKFDLPVIEGDKDLPLAWQNGFYTADGHTSKSGAARVYLYHEKRKLRDHFDFRKLYVQDYANREYGIVEGLKDKFFVPSEHYTVSTRLSWLAGWLDGDGCVYRNGKNQQLVGCSIEKEFLLETQRMLQTLGVSAKIHKMADEGLRKLPKNDGTGEKKDYWCQDSWRLIITSCDVHKLMLLGLGSYLKRLDVVERLPQRDAKQFNKVVSVVDEGRIDDTYCFNEPKRHMGMFNGILTGQCNEIQLMTDEDRTAVCCLSSLNLDKFDEWKDTSLVEDLVAMLDNVLEFFIALAPDALSRAVYSAKKERAIGLGTLGFASYLQYKSIPFESGGFNSAVQENYKIYALIKERAVQGSKTLAEERGEPDDCEGSGMRNSHLMAIAPNASSSSLVNVSPSIEPFAGIAFTAQGRTGSFLIKNKHFEKVLLNYKEDNNLPDGWEDQQWASIVSNDGSVAHLDWLSEHDKKVYKTASEIDQRWVIEHASVRQPKVCQGQSVNLFIRPDATAQEVSDLHFLAWKKGLKGLYYYRTSSKVKASVGDGTNKPLNSIPVQASFDNEECIACEG